VRVERAEPPAVIDVCRAAARAVIELLDDERARPGGDWHERVGTWRDGRIRKLVRRGRGSGWEKAQAVAGVTVHDVAEVRAFVPSPMDAVEEAVARLQIDAKAVELAEPTAVDTVTAGPGTMVVALTPLVAMSWGKRAAQAAHGAQLAWEAAGPDGRAAWDARRRPLQVVFPTAAAWGPLVDAASVRVHDGGFTEIPAGTLTAVAWFAPIA